MQTNVFKKLSIEEQEDVMESYSKSYNNCRRKIEKSNIELSAIIDKIKEAQEQLSEEDIALNKLLVEQNEKNDGLEELELKTEELKNYLKKEEKEIEDNIEVGNNELVSIHKKIDDAKIVLTELNNEVKDVSDKEENDDLTEENEVLKEENGNIANEIKEKKVEVEKMENSVKSFKASIERKAKRIKKASNELEILNDEIRGMKKEIIGIKITREQNKTIVKKKLEKLNEDILVKEEELAKLENGVFALKEYKERLKRIEARLKHTAKRLNMDYKKL